MLQVLKSEFSSTPWLIENLKNIIYLDNWESANPNIPVLCEGDLLHSHVRHWLTNKQLAIYIARGALGNHPLKKRNFWRYSINDWANIVDRDIPYSRWHILNLERHRWKVKEVKKVLVAPSKMTSKVWTPEHNYYWAEFMLDKFPGAEVKIRRKIGKPGKRYETLWSDLDWADLVVSQSSAITCEAFWYGKKVISTEPCTTWLAGQQDLQDWQNPAEPEGRDKWHEHIAWNQFTIEEWTTGIAWNLMKQYIGDIKTYGFKHSYFLT